MMGRLNHDQQQLFYSFRLDEAVPHDHPVREIAAALDLSWVHSELAPFYPKMGRPSIDPELMIRMLIISEFTTRCAKGRHKPNISRCMPGAGLSRSCVGRCCPTCQPSSRIGENPPCGMIGGSRGNVGIIRSPVRASTLPD
jgi:hypothetical protein